MRARGGPSATSKMLTALFALAMLLPASSVLAADPQKDLDEVRRRMQGARGELEHVEQRRTVTIADLDRIDRDLAVLDGRLSELRRDLAGAERALRDAEATLAATTAELQATEQRLGRTREQLRQERETFSARTRAAFMYGAPTMTFAMVDATDIADYARGLRLAGRVMESDRDRVNLVTSLARQVQAEAVELGALRDRQVGQRRVAAARRDDVAGLVAAEQQLRDSVADEREKRQLVLDQLNADKDSHLQMLAHLEAESDKLEQELRRRAEEEARRLAEARARAEAEARRRADEARRLAEARRQAEERARRNMPPVSRGSAGGPVDRSRLQRPADGRITSGYGWRVHPIFGTRRMHTGVDLGGGYGAAVYAAEDGTVISAGPRGGYGNTIIVDHGGGLTTLYAHQSRFAVGPGQRVSRGQVIGSIGATGYATGPHLHFEVRVNGRHRDPMPYL